MKAEFAYLQQSKHSKNSQIFTQGRATNIDGTENLDAREYFENLDKIYAPDHLATYILKPVRYCI